MISDESVAWYWMGEGSISIAIKEVPRLTVG